MPRGLSESVQLLMGGLASAYINSFVFELYNFSASVPETYIAQMVGWVLMAFSMFLSTRIWAFYSHCLQHIHAAKGVQRKCSAPDGRFGVCLHYLICI